MTSQLTTPAPSQASPDRPSARMSTRRSKRSRLDGTRSTTVLTRSVMAAAALYFLFPVWWLIVSASKSKPELYSTPGLWFGDSFRMFDNLQRAINYDQGLYLRWLGNSVLYAGRSEERRVGKECPV